MKIFGKKPKDGENNQPNKSKKLKKKTSVKKKKKPTKNRRAYKRPQDVRLFYIMPVFLVLGISCIVGGVFIVANNTSEYERQILASSMQKGQQLPLRNGTSDGKLTIGNKLLSKDGKTLAVEIKYDEPAHRQLSSFGENYNLYLIDTRGYPMKNAQVSYGMFGTDGSGVLTVHNEDGFENKAFMVFLLDKGILVDSSDLGTPRMYTDTEISKSLARQLAEIDSGSDRQNDYMPNEERMPPTYIIRLNGTDAQQGYRNWTDDRELVEDLFVDGNLEKIRKQIDESNEKIEQAKVTLDEMDKRLEKNPDDNTALQSKNTIERTIEQLEEEVASAEKNFDNISNSTIDRNILSPKQEEFERYTVIDLNRVK